MFFTPNSALLRVHYCVLARISVADHVSDLGEAKSNPVTNKASTSVQSMSLLEDAIGAAAA